VKLVAYIDGSCFGNPGESGYGVVIQDEEGSILESRGCYIGEATNNVAEYRGLLGCLDLAVRWKPESLTVYSDSQLLVNQVNGFYRVKQPHLIKLHAQILDAIKHLSTRFAIHHIPREQNNAADGLARRSIRLQTEIKE
jgi:ribonuclease HI